MSDTSKTTDKTAQSTPTPTVTETYFVPEYGVSVQATSVADAVAKAKKQLGGGTNGS